MTDTTRTKSYSILGAARLFSLPVGLFAGTIALLSVLDHPQFHPAAGLAAALGSLLVQAAANFLNDFSDLQNPALAERLSPEQIRIIRINNRLGLLCLVAAAVLGLYIASLRGLMVVPVALGGLIMALAYNMEPVALKRRGLGALLVFMMMGPYMMPAIAWAATGTLPDTSTWLHSLLFGLPIALLLISNEYRDIRYDTANGDRTLAVRLGPERTRRLYRGLLILTLAAYAALALLRPWWKPAWLLCALLASGLWRLSEQPGPALPPATGKRVLALGLAHSLWFVFPA
ncbi:prenyltransferase [Hahella sp. SMD15-11]|uniref:Prenyltransferase n=1 Tax=Thermohahella caldifontis TaxID=3142973 RepID=A0AB39UX78_9GAMM